MFLKNPYTFWEDNTEVFTDTMICSYLLPDSWVGESEWTSVKRSWTGIVWSWGIQMVFCALLLCMFEFSLLKNWFKAKNQDYGHRLAAECYLGYARPQVWSLAWQNRQTNKKINGENWAPNERKSDELEKLGLWHKAKESGTGVGNQPYCLISEASNSLWHHMSLSMNQKNKPTLLWGHNRGFPKLTFTF